LEVLSLAVPSLRYAVSTISTLAFAWDYITLKFSGTPAKSVEVDGVTYPADSWTNVTPTILSKLTHRLHTQSSHPLCTLRSLIETQFPSFAHLSAPSPIVSTYKNFDELGFPADHPGRSVTDSYYINKDTLLRTHTSAHEVEVFKAGHDRWLLVADVYRRDEIDASHHPVFHQMEGARTFVMNDPKAIEALSQENARLQTKLTSRNILIEDETRISPDNPCQPQHDPEHAELVAQNLKHHLNSLIYALFSSEAQKDAGEPLRVRWIPAYFPFTTPSYEVEVLFNGKWLEILGCGVVQQRTLDLAGALSFGNGVIFSNISLSYYHHLRRLESHIMGIRSWPGAHRDGAVLDSRYSAILVDRPAFLRPVRA
jgi:phenylalanyl-tRNA synthetase alpha chain